MAKRELWVDYTKAIACILVAVGHLLQGLRASSVFPYYALLDWFNMAIYCFHVPLFFICSGYLFQKTASSAKPFLSRTLGKLTALGIPYFVFSIITYLMKLLADGYVNISNRDFLHSIFVYPVAPYWFLYVLFLFFLITPVCRSGRSVAIVLAVAFCARLLSFIIAPMYELPYLVEKVLAFEIWFVLGMAISEFSLTRYLGKRTLFVGALFFPLCVLAWFADYTPSAVRFALGLLGCLFVISAVFIKCRDERCSSVMGVFIKYNMPIFLMHTIFAAGIRMVLLMLGLSNPALHLLLGVLFSFAGPVLAGWIMAKLKWPEFVLYPNKFIGSKKSRLSG